MYVCMYVFVGLDGAAGPTKIVGGYSNKARAFILRN